MKVYEVTIKACIVTHDEMTSPAEWVDETILSELSLCQHVEIEAREMVTAAQPAKVSA